MWWTFGHKKYLGSKRCDDLDEMDMCGECDGSGLEEICDECMEETL